MLSCTSASRKRTALAFVQGPQCKANARSRRFSRKHSQHVKGMFVPLRAATGVASGPGEISHWLTYPFRLTSAYSSAPRTDIAVHVMVLEQPP
jgi:hypothetical protein